MAIQKFHFVTNEDQPERSFVISRDSRNWIDAWLSVSRKIRSKNEPMPSEWLTKTIRVYNHDASAVVFEGTASQLDDALNRDTYGEEHKDILSKFWESV